jgi:DNA-binding transcriptional ArsR family regulator
MARGLITGSTLLAEASRSVDSGAYRRVSCAVETLLSLTTLQVFCAYKERAPVILSSSSGDNDSAYMRILMYIFLGTRGGQNRLKIVRLVKGEAMNANKIASKLSLDYKTIQYHLKVLQENDILESDPPDAKYGTMYFLSPKMEQNFFKLEESLAKVVKDIAPTGGDAQ